MSEVTFNNFSPQTFERFIQDLCVPILGPGVVIFGQAADGGRDATFEGEVPFPSSEQRWNGYVVLQAKFKADLYGDKRDADWLVKELTRELRKFADPKRNLRKPEYYILATNVSLSAVASTGGKDRISKVFQDRCRSLGLRDWAVWTPLELRAFLASASEVRKAYTAWVTPNEVLAELLESLKPKTLRELLPLMLARDFRNERDARLRDAGHDEEQGVPLDSVFVDLPTQSARLLEADAPQIKISVGSAEYTSEDFDGAPQRWPALARLLRRAAAKCDVQPEAAGESYPLPNRLVLLGGPGQGKSTLGQFLAQLARARLLATLPKADLSPEIRDVISPVLSRAKQEMLPDAGPLRFPIRIDLPAFADALQSSVTCGEVLTLSAFITKRLTRGLANAITPDDLRLWLRVCPSLIILDGLDEVPPSANRREVIQAIDGLLDEISFTRADAFIVVTTRPQGYSNDLSPKYWEHWELVPLRPQEALTYAQRLARVRLTDEERQEFVLAALRKACHDDVTQLLMVSPLQVSIMFGIAALKGSIPQDRWDLFDRYYNLLRDREAQKPGATAAVIREHRRQIDALHHEIGFVLQLSSEQAGGATAFLTPAEFTARAQRLLRAEGFESNDVHQISHELVRIATDRLVLLSARVEGRIAFDVRSLQEFMAAAQLTGAPTEYILPRLTAVALSAHWRHVVRIAFSKIFSVVDLGHLREGAVAICHSIDAGDLGTDAQAIRGGALLALELLSDGVAASVPKYLCALTRRALSLLDLGTQFVDRLVRVCRDGNRLEYKVAIDARMAASGDSAPPQASFALALKCLSAGHDDFASLVEHYWPDNLEEVSRIGLVADLHLPEALSRRVSDAQWAVGPSTLLKLFDGVTEESRIQGVFAETFAPNRGATFRNAIKITGTELRAIVRFIGNGAVRAFSVPDTVAADSRKSWLALRAAHVFDTSPSRATLAAAARAFGKCKKDALPISSRLSWPIAALLALAREGLELENLAEQAERGEFGDARNWRAAEERWHRKGLLPSDFVAWNEGYLTKHIAERGAPPVASLLVETRTESSAASRKDVEDAMAQEKLLNAAAEVSSPARRFSVLRFFLSSEAFVRFRESGKLRAVVKRTVGELLSDDPRAAFALVSLVSDDKKAWEDAAFLHDVDSLGRGRTALFYFRNDYSWGEVLIGAYNAHPQLRGLLSVICGHQLRGLAKPSKIRAALKSLDKSAFEMRDTDPLIVQSATAYLKIMKGTWGVEDISALACAIAASPTFNEARSILQYMDHPAAVQLLLSLFSHLNARNRTLRESIFDVINQMVSARPSQIGTPHKLRKLRLPEYVSER